MIDGDGRHDGIVAALTYLRQQGEKRQMRFEDRLTVVFSFAIGLGFAVLVLSAICGILQ